MNEGQGNINFARAELDTRRGALGAGRWAPARSEKKQEAESEKREEAIFLPCCGVSSVKRVCKARVLARAQSPEPRAQSPRLHHTALFNGL